MKKLLLSLTLLCAVFCGHAQRDLWFNEVYPEPSKSRNNTEFVELYNTSTSAIPLDCYVIVSYFNTGTERGVYVYNFPTGASINPLSHYVIASGIPIKYQQNSTYSGSNISNWNSTLDGGYILKYVLPTGGQWPSQGASVGNNFNDFMFINTGNDASVNLLLFRINNDGTSTLVNSVFGNGNGTVPAAVTSLPSLTVPTGSSPCANGFTSTALNFNNITFNNTETFNINQATGNDNAYARYGDAICGGWDKFTGPPNTTLTPGQPNPLGTAVRTPLLTTAEGVFCNSSIQVQITAPTTSTSYPVEARLYLDNNNDKKLDGGDTYVESITINSGSATYYSFTTVHDPTKNYIIVYRTSLGCFDKVIVPTLATGSLTTTAKDVCNTNSRIDFTITGVSGNIAPYVFPINVELRHDANGNGILDADETTVIQQRTITSFSTTIYTFTNPDPTQRVILVYNTAQSCFNKTEVPQPTVSTFTPVENYFCGRRVNVTIPSGSADDITYALPIVVSVYHDANGNGQLDEDITVPAILLGRITITSFSATNHVIELAEANWNKDIIVEYRTNQTCFTKVALSPTETASGEITVSGEINYSSSNGVNVSTLTYFVVQAGTATNAYPLQLNVYEDADRDGVIDAGETIIETRNINAPAAPGTTYTVNMTDFRSAAIVVATATQGCSQTLEAIANTQAPLPVRLASFTAKRNNEKVHLAWETTMELNNSGFDIQRKVGNGEWKTIAFMFSQANAGNSNAVLRYTYTDVNPAKGVSQYRLRQVDIDTRATLSEVRSVRGLEQAGRLLLYPNPSTDGKLNLVFDEQNGNRSVIISDISGRVIKQYRGVTDDSIQIEGLQNGMYTLQITNVTTGETTVQKVVVKKR